MNAAIRTRLLLAFAFAAAGVAGALLAPAQPPVIAVQASHAAPRAVSRMTAVPAVTDERAVAPVVNERLRTDI